MAQAETGWSSVPTDRGAALLLVAMALGAAACGGSVAGCAWQVVQA